MLAVVDAWTEGKQAKWRWEDRRTQIPPAQALKRGPHHSPTLQLAEGAYKLNRVVYSIRYHQTATRQSGAAVACLQLQLAGLPPLFPHSAPARARLAATGCALF